MATAQPSRANLSAGSNGHDRCIDLDRQPRWAPFESKADAVRQLSTLRRGQLENTDVAVAHLVLRFRNMHGAR